MAIHHRIIPKTSAVARGIAGMFGRAICTLAQPFPSPPQSAWHGPPDHQLKKFFRCAGRQVRPLLDKALFSSGGAPQKGRVFVQKALLTGLVPQCSIAPGSSRGGLSLGLFLCQVEPPAELRLPAFSCRMSARCPSLRSWLLRRHGAFLQPRLHTLNPCVQNSRRAFW